MRPTSPVVPTWVPPSAWRSSPTMSTTRTSVRLGGRRLTLVRMRLGSRSASARGRKLISTGSASPSWRFSSVSTGSLSSGSQSGSSKSRRPSPGFMLPPVTGDRYRSHTTPHSACIAVCVRMSRYRRSQSTSPRSVVPRPGTSPSSQCHTPESSWVTRTTSRRSSPTHNAPVSWGWPPPPG